jgi:hypothetical protein
MSKILFKYTTRSRRSNFLRGIDSIVSNIADKSNYHILISVESELNDPVMHPLPQLDCPHTYCVNPGKPTTKVDAINRNLNEFLKVCDAQIIVNMSDDMLFVEKGFDNIIRNAFNSLDQYIHFNDGNQKANVCTMHIVGREYYNRFNYIYNPEYLSLWCDVENDLVAKQLGRYKYMGDGKVIFKHLHPAWGFCEPDEQYKKTEAKEMWDKDESTFNKRKANNFDL